MKLATWNVALPISLARRVASRAFTDSVQADILVLTETHDGFSPGYVHSCSSADGRDVDRKLGHRWVNAITPVGIGATVNVVRDSDSHKSIRHFRRQDVERIA